jgi:hypothetical protein
MIAAMAAAVSAASILRLLSGRPGLSDKSAFGEGVGLGLLEEVGAGTVIIGGEVMTATGAIFENRKINSGLVNDPSNVRLPSRMQSVLLGMN